MQLSEDGTVLIRVTPADLREDGSIQIPGGVTSIGVYAFEGCSGLTQLALPSGLTSIGAGAFYDCSGLTQLTLPSSVTSIGGMAFWGCSGLTQLTLPSGLTSIAEYTFSGCQGLTQLTLPSGLTVIGALALSACSGLTQLTLPSSLTSIGERAFGGCSGLRQLILPSSLTSIGEAAFWGCSGLKNTLGSIVIDTSNRRKYKRILSLIPKESRSQVMTREQYMNDKAAYITLILSLKQKKIPVDIVDLLVRYTFSDNPVLLNSHIEATQKRRHRLNLGGEEIVSQGELNSRPTTQAQLRRLISHARPERFGGATPRRRVGYYTLFHGERANCLEQAIRRANTVADCRLIIQHQLHVFNPTKYTEPPLPDYLPSEMKTRLNQASRWKLNSRLGYYGLLLRLESECLREQHVISPPLVFP